MLTDQTFLKPLHIGIGPEVFQHAILGIDYHTVSRFKTSLSFGNYVFTYLALDTVKNREQFETLAGLSTGLKTPVFLKEGQPGYDLLYNLMSDVDLVYSPAVCASFWIPRRKDFSNYDLKRFVDVLSLVSESETYLCTEESLRALLEK